MSKLGQESGKSDLLPCGRSRPKHDHHELSESDWRARLERYISDTGLRRSDQRFQIAECILHAGGHLSAQEIIERVRKEYPEIGPATVYRNLKVLCDAGVLTETVLNTESHVVYEVSANAHHDHIVCLDCDEIFEFHEPKIETLQAKLCEASEFQLTGHRHVLYAHCSRLKGAQAR